MGFEKIIFRKQNNREIPVIFNSISYSGKSTIILKKPCYIYSINDIIYSLFNNLLCLCEKLCSLKLYYSKGLNVLKKIFLVRHCLAEGQHKDSPLTTVGMRQAILLSQFFNKQNIAIDSIISSPYLRAIESIKPFAESKNLDVELDSRLQERILSNEPVDDWMEVLEQSFNEMDFKLPGGESANDAIARGNDVFDSILRDNELNNVILVSHGNLISLLLKRFDKTIGFDEWKNLNNPDVFLIESNEEEHSVRCLWEKS